MPDVIITYETVYETLRREKFRNELQLLDVEFFDNVLSYLNEKSVILDSQKNRDSIFSSEYKKTSTLKVSPLLGCTRIDILFFCLDY